MAFMACGSLRSVSLPSTLRTLGSHTFVSCPLQYIEIPEGVTRIEESTFFDCASLDAAYLPGSSISSIYEDSFPAHTRLIVPNADCSLPDGLKSIGSGAFYECSALRRVTLPNGLSEMGARAFADAGTLMVYCESLGAMQIDPAAFTNTDVTFLCYSDSGMAAAGEGLQARLILLDVPQNPSVLPAELTEVGEEALMGTAARWYVLPEGTQRIGARAFADCPNLLWVSVPVSVGSIAPDAFEGNEWLGVIAPEGSVGHAFAIHHGLRWLAP